MPWLNEGPRKKSFTILNANNSFDVALVGSPSKKSSFRSFNGTSTAQVSVVSASSFDAALAA